MHQIILFWNYTLHVSDGLSVHHQELKTVHTATGHMSNRYCCLLASGYEKELMASRQQYLFDICLLLYVQSCAPEDGRKDRPKHVECLYKIK